MIIRKLFAYIGIGFDGRAFQAVPASTRDGASRQSGNRQNKGKNGNSKSKRNIFLVSRRDTVRNADRTVTRAWPGTIGARCSTAATAASGPNACADACRTASTTTITCAIVHPGPIAPKSESAWIDREGTEKYRTRKTNRHISGPHLLDYAELFDHGGCGQGPAADRRTEIQNRGTRPD